MYPQRSRMVRQTLRLGLVVTLIVLAASACGSGGDAKGGAEEAATIKTVAGDGGEQLGDGGPATEAGFCGPRCGRSLHRRYVQLPNPGSWLGELMSRCARPSENGVLGLRRRAWLYSPKCLEGVYSKTCSFRA